MKIKFFLALIGLTNGLIIGILSVLLYGTLAGTLPPPTVPISTPPAPVSVMLEPWWLVRAMTVTLLQAVITVILGGLLTLHYTETKR